MHFWGGKYAQNTLKNAKNQIVSAKNIFGKTHMKFLAEFLANSGGYFMRSKNFKGSKCVKMKLQKSEDVVRTFDNIQTAYAQILDKNENIQKIQCNVPLEGIEEGEFTTDFLCVKADGDLIVRECVFRKKLSLPRTCKLLDVSRHQELKEKKKSSLLPFLFLSTSLVSSLLFSLFSSSEIGNERENSFLLVSIFPSC